MVYRTDNEPFKVLFTIITWPNLCTTYLCKTNKRTVFFFVTLQNQMQRFTAKIVDMMKEEKLYASQGGPIVLSQVKNLTQKLGLIIFARSFVNLD